MRNIKELTVNMDKINDYAEGLFVIGGTSSG